MKTFNRESDFARFTFNKRVIDDLKNNKKIKVDSLSSLLEILFDSNYNFI